MRKSLNKQAVGVVDFFACYNFKRKWLLVEMMLNVPSSEIDWCAMLVPDDDEPEDNWQCPYMEQYLNADGTEKICETYDEPQPDVNPCRVAFFIYKDGAEKLRTPYGDFDLTVVKPLPKRLKNIIEFEEED